ncbi:MAG TPA: UDP-N-acetylglucosamine 2-epimerase (non-hydrolyzing) [Bacteroidota bacterium]|nr:UDP-N-acetylglucosamine 2-epimerase (non-hydrolyzing) [Bacteroidota bacterium]
MNNLKVMTVVGTRPELIRLSRVIAALDEHTDHVLVHTGQNYDYSLNGVFFDEMRIRRPDHFMNVDTSSLGSVLGGVITGAERIVQDERPDAMLILGDTNSSMAGIMARRLRIPLYHMEAGNRCFDLNVPEEINRRIIDHIADFNLVYTEHARRHLLAEGLSHRRIYLTGSPMREVLEHYRVDIERSDILQRLGIAHGGYFMVSVHREENVDKPERLTCVLDVLQALHESYGVPVIVSTHPRTLKRIESLEQQPKLASNVRFMQPFGFFDYVHLQQHAMCTISDSGTIAEESSILAFPAVTIRDAIERPEALDTGSIALTGLSVQSVLRNVEYAVLMAGIERNAVCPVDYTVSDTSARVVRLILGTANLSNAWDGIR